MLNRFSLVTFAILSLCCSPAHGQDFFNAGVSARTGAHAGAYSPEYDNVVDALALNPAGLAALNRPTANVGGSAFLASGSFSNSVNSQSPMRSNGGATPFGAFGTPLGHSRWTLAAGFTPDLLSSSKWQLQDAPGVAGVTYGQQREQSQIVALRTSAGLAYRFSARLSAGVSVGAIYNSNTLIMPYVFQSHPALAGLKTLLDLHTAGVGWNTSFGVVAQPTHRLLMNAAYRTRSAITSTGAASGNMGAQFSALGIPFQPDFRYRAQVHVDIPQSALLGASWQQSHALRFDVQSTWTNWKNSFYSLPVSLTAGSNSDINSFLASSSLKDTVPLRWKDQYSFRAAADRALTESLSFSAGYSHSTNPVPTSTLSPLTAAIMQNGLAAGLSYRRDRARFDFAYQVNLPNRENVGTSSLLSGEFNNSSTRIMTQAITLSATFGL